MKKKVTPCRPKSSRYFQRARKHIPGGVNSPVRAFQAVGGDPVFFQSAKGAILEDVDGNRYIDFCASWGPMILGHAPKVVRDAVRNAAGKGTSFGTPHAGEVELAEELCKAIPSLDQVRLVSSGTEACMSAIRLARGVTGRDGVVKFDGAYHGHADGLLVRAGSGAATLGIPTSPGVPRATAAHTAVLPYNNEDGFSRFMKKQGRKIACVIVEPVAGNMGVVPPQPGFLQALRKETSRYGALLIFDEVITGFRVARGGAQSLFRIRPDLTVLGKVIGGGLPVGAYGGRRSIMKQIAPEGPIYQAGTLSGNPLAVAAGLAQLRALDSETYQHLEQRSFELETGLHRAAQKHGIPLVINRVGSMMTPFFQKGPVYDWSTVAQSDTAKYAKFFRGMLQRGIYLAPSPFEALFVSRAHTRTHITRTLRAAEEVFREM